jgi:hypothetical protein
MDKRETTLEEYDKKFLSIAGVFGVRPKNPIFVRYEYFENIPAERD